eukprot:TRINITY_DN67697_c0_g1_i1.p1 TRINITY_DN67697_c0_g1~~TRINITY_DN67697_c0_g1_i1.p1  ORF type:complete len:214 (+),score=20.04 TRINITY_DN67697_c0_g1_i1:83-643(+)
MDARVVFGKTKLCKFFLKDKCTRGSACTFAHSTEELTDQPDLRCTKMCRHYLQKGQCTVSGCTFAHSRAELRRAECATLARGEESQQQRGISERDQSKDEKDTWTSSTQIRLPPSAPPPKPSALVELRKPPGLNARTMFQNGSTDGPLYILTSLSSAWESPIKDDPLYVRDFSLNYLETIVGSAVA